MGKPRGKPRNLAGMVLDMSIEGLIELARNPQNQKQFCREEFGDICPKRIYIEKSRVVIDYGTHIVAIPIRRKETYEQWVQKRDKRIIKKLKLLRRLKEEYEKQKEVVKEARKAYYEAKRLYKDLAKQWNALRLTTLEQIMKQRFVEMSLAMGRYRTEQAKLKVIKSHIKAIFKSFERSRRIAKAMFESYQPLHSLPISNWKSKIEMTLKALDMYLEHGDINGFLLTLQLNKKELKEVSMWHEWLNEQIFELTEDLLIKHFDESEDIEQDKKEKFKKPFKKPLIVKLIQNELYSFNFDSVAKSIELWLKTKP